MSKIKSISESFHAQSKVRAILLSSLCTLYIGISLFFTLAAGIEENIFTETNITTATMQIHGKIFLTLITTKLNLISPNKKTLIKLQPSAPPSWGRGSFFVIYEIAKRHNFLKDKNSTEVSHLYYYYIHIFFTLELILQKPRRKIFSLLFCIF